MNTGPTIQPPTFAAAPGYENLPHLQGMGRRQRRAAETRLRLFRCALQLFAERGFANVTVEEITEACLLYTSRCRPRSLVRRIGNLLARLFKH